MKLNLKNDNGVAKKLLIHELIRNKYTYKKSLDLARSTSYENAIKRLNDTGILVIENFFNDDDCNNAIKLIDKAAIKYKKNIQTDRNNSDKRIFGINRINIDNYFNRNEVNSVKKFHESILINDITKIFYTEDFCGFVMGARMDYSKNNLGSGGGWHRDSVHKKQIKSILYLTDVTESHGPFQYLEKSHLPDNIFADTFQFNLYYNKNRFTNDEIRTIQIHKKYKLSTLTAKKGTLILADTRGLHRGMPIKSGVRYSLTNYFFSGNKTADHIEKICIKTGN